jgi:hypothetical protein
MYLSALSARYATRGIPYSRIAKLAQLPPSPRAGQSSDETQRAHGYRWRHRRFSSISARLSFRDSHRSLTRLPQCGACRGAAVSGIYASLILKHSLPNAPRLRQKYHSWMQSAELRELTASEELTLEQEYAMQRELFPSLSPDQSSPYGVPRR